MLFWWENAMQYVLIILFIVMDKLFSLVEKIWFNDWPSNWKSWEHHKMCRTKVDRQKFRRLLHFDGHKLTRSKYWQWTLCTLWTVARLEFLYNFDRFAIAPHLFQQIINKNLILLVCKCLLVCPTYLELR